MPQARRIGTSKALAVPVPEMQADMAHLRRIGCWNTMQGDTRSLGFVRHELPQLIECPTIASAAFRGASGHAEGRSRIPVKSSSARSRPEQQAFATRSLLISWFVWR